MAVKATPAIDGTIFRSQVISGGSLAGFRISERNTSYGESVLGPPVSSSLGSNTFFPKPVFKNCLVVLIYISFMCA